MHVLKSLHRRRVGLDQPEHRIRPDRSLERDKVGHPADSQPHTGVPERSLMLGAQGLHRCRCVREGLPGRSLERGRVDDAAAPKPKGLLREDIFMQDVSCLSSACTADGFYINGKGNDDTAVEAWNGTRWVVQATLDPSIGMNGVTSSILAAVSCSSPKACTAVGDDEDDKDAWVPLVERWNGAGWVTQPTPALSTEGRVTSAQVAAGLTALTPGMAHAIVTIRGGGYEAAVYDKTGHIDFWKFSGGKWAEVGRSSYPRLQPFPTPLGSVVGRQLKGMADAIFIARGIFTGDSTGQAIAFGKGQRGWGTIAWEPGNVLVPTGNGSTDNDTPGIYFSEQLSGGQLETTNLNPYFSTAMNYYPLTATGPGTPGHPTSST